MNNVRRNRFNVACWGIDDWIRLPLWFIAGILAVYLVVTFDHDIRRVHRLVHRHYR